MAGEGESESAPPFMKRLFGEHWEDLDSHPDCWNRWFGPDSDGEEEGATKTDERLEQMKRGATNLTDHNWIKQRLDEEVYKYVIEELKLKENRSLTWRRAKALVFSCLIGLCAQFPYLIPAEGFVLAGLQWVLILGFLVTFSYGQVLSFLAPWNTVVEISDQGEQPALFIETELPKYSVEYKVLVRSKRDRNIFESAVVSGTVLFTPAGKSTPEPLQETIDDLIDKVAKRCRGD